MKRERDNLFLRSVHWIVFVVVVLVVVVAVVSTEMKCKAGQRNAWHSGEEKNDVGKFVRLKVIG